MEKKSINLRPHHIRSFRNFNLKRQYELSDEEFVADFKARNKKMVHGTEFILGYKKFLTGLREDGTQKIESSDREDVVCKNCDIRDKCIAEGSEIHHLAKFVDEKSKKELGLEEGVVVSVRDYL